MQRFFLEYVYMQIDKSTVLVKPVYPRMEDFKSWRNETFGQLEYLIGVKCS